MQSPLPHRFDTRVHFGLLVIWRYPASLFKPIMLPDSTLSTFEPSLLGQHLFPSTSTARISDGYLEYTPPPSIHQQVNTFMFFSCASYRPSAYLRSSEIGNFFSVLARRGIPKGET